MYHFKERTKAALYSIIPFPKTYLDLLLKALVTNAKMLDLRKTPPPRFKYCWIRVRVRIHISTNPNPPMAGVFFLARAFYKRSTYLFESSFSALVDIQTKK